ncbi:type II secretion system F family protein [Acidithiobacillus caldus]
MAISFRKDDSPVKKKPFEWVYIDPKGAKTVGQIDAASMNEAKLLLRKRGVPFTYLKPIQVKKARLKEDHIVLFLRQWSAVQSAGVPVTDGIKMIADTTDNAGLRELLLKIYGSLMDGETLSDAFAQFPKWFDPVSISLLKAAQEAGILDSVLARMAVSREKQRILRKKTRSALMYPGITVVVMFAVVAILMIKVIPVFAHLFKSFGSKLPWLTTQVVDLSYWMQDHVFVLIAGPILAVVLFRYCYRRYFQFRWAADRLFLKAPVFGQLLIKSAVTRFCQIFAEMQGAGVPMTQILETLEHVSGNTVIDASVTKAKNEVLRGGRVSVGLKESVFPALAVQMISVGENSGELEKMLAKTGDFYETEVKEMVDRMSTLLEPMIMILLGFIVGTLVVAMYLPMLDMGQAILKGSGAQG